MVSAGAGVVVCSRRVAVGALTSQLLILVVRLRVILNERVILLLCVVCRWSNWLLLAECIWMLSDVIDKSLVFLLLADRCGRRANSIQQAIGELLWLLLLLLKIRLESARVVKTQRLLLLLLIV